MDEPDLHKFELNKLPPEMKEQIVEAIRNAPDGPTRGEEVENLWTVVAVDKDGNESLAAMLMGETLMPLVCTQYRNVQKLRECGAFMRKHRPGIRMVLRVWSKYEDIETL